MNQKKHGLQCLTRPLGGDVESSHMIMLEKSRGFFGLDGLRAACIAFDPV